MPLQYHRQGAYSRLTEVHNASRDQLDRAVWPAGVIAVQNPAILGERYEEQLSEQHVTSTEQLERKQIAKDLLRLQKI